VSFKVILLPRKSAGKGEGKVRLSRKKTRLGGPILSGRESDAESQAERVPPWRKSDLGKGKATTEKCMAGKDPLT